MKRIIQSWGVTCALLAAVFTQSAMAQIGSASAAADRFGSFFAFSAKPIGRHNFYLFQNIKYFSGNATRVESFGPTSRNVTDFGLQMGFNFGLSENWDFVASGNFMQTSNLSSQITDQDIVSLSKTYDIPDDLMLSVRYAPYSFSGGKWRLGGMFGLKFEGIGFANAPLQVYAAGSTEAGLTLLASFFQRPDIPETGFGIHLNVQYWNHMDLGRDVNFRSERRITSTAGGIAPSLIDTAVAKSNTSSVRYAVGATYPIPLGDRYLYIVGDVYGLMYLTKPPFAAYSRQNYAYAALGVKYQVMDWMAFHLGAEFQVLKNTTETTVSSPFTGIEDLTVSKSDYPSWRLLAGITMPLSPRAAGYSLPVETVTEVQREDRKKNEVENILYSDQEIQKRSVNFIPIKEMRTNYRDIVNDYVKVLEPKDKKPVEEDYSSETTEEGSK